MLANNEEFQKILELGRFARFRHTNLHIHTPATAWDWNHVEYQTRKAEDSTPEDFFEELNKTTLDLVAITDHNTIAWCESLMKLAEKGRKKGTSKLHILPGVEITSYEGPHLIAIFNEDYSVLEKIQAMLIRLGLSGKGEQDDKVSKLGKREYTLSEVLEEIDGLDGLAIAPHVHSNPDGIWGNKNFRSRHDVLTNEKLRILAAPSGHIKRVVEPDGSIRLLYKNMPSETYQSYAFINVSDCHRLDDFELNTTWIKMGEPSLEGIRQIIYEPEQRVSHKYEIQDDDVEFPEAFHFSEPETVSYPHILGLSINGGNLDGQIISFSPHQNSIIGKNYAGKSAVLDFLRFGLDALPQTNDDRYDGIVDRLSGILQEGGMVTIFLVGKNSHVYKISRVLTCSKKKRKIIIDGKPEISLFIDEKFRKETDLHIDEIIGLEVYPQGEVVKIKDNATEQIRIIDSLGKLKNLLVQIEEFEVLGENTVYGDLSINGEKIIDLQEKIENLSEEVQGKKELKSEIEDLQKIFDSGQIDELRSWAEVNGKINSHLSSLDELGDIASDILSHSLLDDLEESKSGAQLKKSLNCLKKANATPSDFEVEAEEIFYQALHIYRVNTKKGLDTLAACEKLLQELNTAREEKYQNILEKLREVNESEKTEDVYTVLLERFTEKQESLSYLEAREDVLSEACKDLDEERQLREKLLITFQEKLEDISSQRKEVVNLINDGAAENVKAELIERGDKTTYRVLLTEIVNNLVSVDRRIREKTMQIEFVVDNLLPSELVELLRENDLKGLITKTRISENTAKIIMSMGEQDIQKLETCPVYDKFQITFRKEGETNFTPIESGLSGGEQALALISVAMIPKSVPLVIDQPEDELGPSLITNELVEQIRNVKDKRQLIFVTHVANVPVLGDSEQITYIKQLIDGDRKYSVVDCSGSLEDIQIIEKLLELDGGEKAFQKRNERYSPLISRR